MFYGQTNTYSDLKYYGFEKKNKNKKTNKQKNRQVNYNLVRVYNICCNLEGLLRKHTTITKCASAMVEPPGLCMEKGKNHSSSL